MQSFKKNNSNDAAFWAVFTSPELLHYITRFHTRDGDVVAARGDVYSLRTHGHYYVFTEKAMEMAAMNGHLETLKWLLYEKGIECTEWGVNFAAMNGHLDMVKWLYENGVECTPRGADWAAMNGHLKMVEWLREMKALQKK